MIRRSADFLAGMPNLALSGLSENWLLKECGNQHWRALAELFGLPLPDFRDSDGAPVYAAFVAVRMGDAQLQLIGENHRFTLDTHLCPSGRARFFSVHRLLLGERECARIEMISTQVSRREAGNNQSVTRTELPEPVTQPDRNRAALQSQASRLMDSSKAFRTGSWTQWQGLERTSGDRLPGLVFHPCPHTDFNGADFLYFANFQAAADRAEWQWNRNRQLWQVTDRQLNYYGNINVGDALHLEFGTLRCDETSLTHWLSVRRDSDGTRIADILTRKQAIDAQRYRWAGRRP